MTTWTYVDESKYRGYLLVAVTIEAPDLPAARRLVDGLILPGQYRVHMRKENPRRKKQIISALCDAGITAHVYADRRHRSDLAARAACLRAIVVTGAGPDTRLVIEQDDGLIGHDNQVLIEATRAAGLADTFRYEHQRANSAPLLALPDVVAWAWAKGGDWRRRVRPTIVTVHGV